MEKIRPVDPAGVATLLPELSADEVHKNILRCHLLRSRVERKLLEWIRVLVENGYSKDLGSCSPAQYILDNLRYEKSEAYRILDVVEAMEKLPLSLDAFQAGRISWTHLKALADVAGRNEEKAWLTFALGHSAADLVEEIETGRPRPRKRRFGLPNRTVDFKVRLKRADREIVRKALEKRAAQIVEARGPEKGRPTPEEVLLDICREILRTEPRGAGAGSERIRSLYDLVVLQCPDCHESHLLSKDGPIEVDRKFVAAIEGKARRMEIRPEEIVRGEALDPEKADEEVPAEMERKVLALFDHSCARCGTKLDLHIHHVLFRSNGGSNELFNLIPTCRRCHGCIHTGSLEVYRDSMGRLYWRTRAERLTALLKDEVEELAAIPAAPVQVPTEPTESTVEVATAGATAASAVLVAPSQAQSERGEEPRNSDHPAEPPAPVPAPAAGGPEPVAKFRSRPLPG